MINDQHTGLEEPFWMFDLPVGTALQEFCFPVAGIKREPVALVTDARNFLVRISNTIEAELPMDLRLSR